jgi:hypothetical protein
MNKKYFLQLALFSLIIYLPVNGCNNLIPVATKTETHLVSDKKPLLSPVQSANAKNSEIPKPSGSPLPSPVSTPISSSTPMLPVPSGSTPVTSPLGPSPSPTPVENNSSSGGSSSSSGVGDSFSNVSVNVNTNPPTKEIVTK